MSKKCLVLGGTGAIGSYVTLELLRLGYLVDVTSRSKHSSIDDHLSYVYGDAKDDDFLSKILQNKYDAIIDFMVYSTDEFKKRHELLLKSAKHYIFTSSARVFAESKSPISERTPRLLDNCEDSEYLRSDEYALAKARQEDILMKSKYKNWTIIRPTITYGHGRFQLGTLEANTVVFRSLKNRSVIMPDTMMKKITTMTWAGDVAKMVTKIVLNKKAFANDFNLVTNEAHSWEEVSSYYNNLIGLKVKTISLKKYIQIVGGEYQMKYSRMFNRRFNNDKILNLTGLKQGDFTLLYDGLKNELADFIKSPKYQYINEELNSSMDIETSSLINKIRRKLRIRTRTKNLWNKLCIKDRLIILKRKIRIRTRTKILLATVKNRKKAGAIISLGGYYNYGNIVQRFALKTFLKNNGYVFDCIKTQEFIDRQDRSIYGNMIDFVDRYIDEREFNQINILAYRKYIVGSDQVWRDWYGNKWEKFGIFFLDFLGGRKTKRIAYAASFGVDNLDRCWD
jgi:nucleoside-diphosphate-sugar epimerase